MITLRTVIGAGMLALLPVAPVRAQNEPAGYYQDLATAGGQLDALALACGKTDKATVKTHSDELRKRFAAKGLAPAEFDQLYDAAFNSLTSQAASNPAAIKQTCEQLAQGVPPSS